MASGDEERKDDKDRNEQTPSNVIEIGSRPSNRDANASNNLQTIAKHSRRNVIEIGRRSFIGVT